MTTLTVMANGQVTLCKDVLQHLGVQPGDRITVDKRPNGRVVVRAAAPGGWIGDTFGMLKRDGGPSLSIEDIGAVAAEGWAGRR